MKLTSNLHAVASLIVLPFFCDYWYRLCWKKLQTYLPVSVAAFGSNWSCPGPCVHDQIDSNSEAYRKPPEDSSPTYLAQNMAGEKIPHNNDEYPS